MTSIDLAGGIVTCVLLLISPFIISWQLQDFANHPKLLFIHSGLACLLLLFCLKWLLVGYLPVTLSRHLIPLAAFPVWVACLVPWAHNRAEAIPLASHLLFCLLFAGLIIVWFRGKLWPNRFVMALVAGLAGTSILGNGQYFFNWTIVPQTAAPAAAFANRTVAAHFLSLTIPLLPFAWGWRPGVTWRLLIGTVSIFALLFLVVSDCRAAWLAGGASLLFMTAGWGYVAIRKRLRTTQISPEPAGGITGMVGTIIVVCVVVGCVAGLTRNPTILSGLDRVLPPALRHEIAHESKPGDQKPPTSGMARLALWQNSLSMIAEHRFSGWGPGNFKVFYPLFHRAVVKDQLFNEHRRPSHLHNDFLQVAVETGLVGLFLYVGLLTYALLMVLRLLESSLSLNEQLLVLGIGGGLVGLVAQSLLSFPLYQALPPLILYLFLGLLIVITERDDSDCNIIKNKLPFHFSLVFTVVIMIGISYYVLYQMSAWHHDQRYRRLLNQEARGNWNAMIAAGPLTGWENRYKLQSQSLLGRAHLARGEAELAIACLSHTLQQDPHNLQDIINLGLARQQLGDTKLAIQAYDRLLALKPDSYLALTNKGKICLTEKDYETAAECFIKAAVQNPEDIPIRLNAGFTLYKLGRYVQAAKEFEVVVTQRPDEPAAHKSLAYLYHRFLHQPRKARLHMQKFIALAPEDKASQYFKTLIVPIK